MTLILTLERGPQPQAVRQMRLETGDLVIGRSADADWQIDDPDLFVSRAHCTVSGRPGDYRVTDTSTGGLFVDDARAALGGGNSAPLRDGTRLRLGDYVVRVEIREAASEAPQMQAPAPERQPPPPQRTGAAGFADDDFFARAEEVKKPPPRPAELPDPFEKPAPGAWSQPRSRPMSPAFDDPFSLDPLPSSRTGGEGSRRAPDFLGFEEPTPEPEPPQEAREQRSPPRDPAPPPATPAPLQPPPRPSARPPGDDALREAFLRGLGADAADFPEADPIAEMEAFGREYRLMMEGLMHLLRKRAEEKGNARIAQTTIGSMEVNPLKFLPNVDAALATFLADRAPGFLPADAAIAGAVRDLAHHHVSAWRGVQGALQRMIERFDPAALEEELKTRSAIETLMAGGRRAKLWELYEQRYREIARSAEERFLGEIGSDFRDAYENDKGN